MLSLLTLTGGITKTHKSPGEPLPQFPKLTHSANPDLDGLKPYRTPCSVLRSIPVGCDNHELTERQIKCRRTTFTKSGIPTRSYLALLATARRVLLTLAAKEE